MNKKITVIHPENKLQTLLDLTGIDREAYYFKVCNEIEIDEINVKAIPVNHADDMQCFGYTINK